jgi:cellulose biosynthesis protein BcsQ
MFHLTPQQLQVVDALSNGATLTTAAAQAGIHRNTIANWHNFPDFREALAIAHHDRAILYRDRAVDLADLAFEAIRTVLTDPNSSPSIRLRAAIFIIDKVVTPPKFEKEDPAGMAEPLAAMEEEADRMQPSQPPADAQNCTIMPNEPFFAQQAAQPPADAQNCTIVPNDMPSTRTILHKSSNPTRRPEPKIGRNATCPCGSGRKYKHCCLGKSSAAA